MYQNQIKNDQSSSLYDMVFLMAAGFFVLFIVALWYVNPIAKLGQIDYKAEFLITITWPDDLDVDIDTWIMDPNGTLVWFQQKTPNNSLIVLERDDLGHSNDKFEVNGKEIILKENIERSTIRGIMPGEYIINLHYFSDKAAPKAIAPVNVKIEKLNPMVKKVFETETPIILNKKGQEVTVVRFTVDVDGNVTNVTTKPFISLIESREEQKRSQPSGSTPNPLKGNK